MSRYVVNRVSLTERGDDTIETPVGWLTVEEGIATASGAVKPMLDNIIVLGPDGRRLTPVDGDLWLQEFAGEVTHSGYYTMHPE